MNGTNLSLYVQQSPALFVQELANGRAEIWEVKRSLVFELTQLIVALAGCVVGWREAVTHPAVCVTHTRVPS
jgi:hypothetical protein